MQKKWRESRTYDCNSSLLETICPDLLEVDHFFYCNLASFRLLLAIKFRTPTFQQTNPNADIAVGPIIKPTFLEKKNWNPGCWLADRWNRGSRDICSNLIYELLHAPNWTQGAKSDERRGNQLSLFPATTIGSRPIRDVLSFTRYHITSKFSPQMTSACLMKNLQGTFLAGTFRILYWHGFPIVPAFISRKP